MIGYNWGDVVIVVVDIWQTFLFGYILVIDYNFYSSVIVQLDCGDNSLMIL